MVDLLGCVGCLNDAEDLLQSNPSPSNMVGWIFLLTHCKIHGDVALAQRCVECVLNVDGETTPGYVLMSQVYVHAGMQVDADIIEEQRECANA